MHRVLKTLPDAFHKVISAIGVIGQYTKQEELEYLLAPFMDVRILRAVLERLAEGRFVVYNRQRRTFGLHHYDLRYATQTIPEGDPSDVSSLPLPFTRYVLNHRMAQFHLTRRKPKAEWDSIKDLDPQLHEIEFRMTIKDYDTAADILLEIDFHYLLLWGYIQPVLDLHTRLQGHIENNWLAQSSAGNLGSACYLVGKIDDAIQHYTTAITMARADNDQAGEGAWLGNLGNTYYVLGQLQKACDYYEQALTINRANHDQRSASNHLGNLANVYADLGEIDKALDYYDQALTIAREIQDTRAESRHLGNWGDALVSIRQFDAAFPLLTQALTLAQHLKSPSAIQYCHSYLAHAYWLAGDIAQAHTHITEARSYDVPDNNASVAALAGCIALCRGKSDEAQSALHEGIAFADKLISQTPQLFALYYTRAIGYVGLWCISNDETQHQMAEASYQTGISYAQCIASYMTIGRCWKWCLPAPISTATPCYPC